MAFRRRRSRFRRRGYTGRRRYALPGMRRRRRRVRRRRRRGIGRSLIIGSRM